MTTTATRRALSGEWTADPIHSSVGFEVEHLGVSMFRGRFRDYEAVLTAGDAGLQISGATRVDSVDVDDDQLRGHLLSPDFFDAERAPEIRFQASNIAPDGGQLAVAGDLTIRGETRPVEARGRIGEPGVDPAGKERVAVELEAAVDRREFGIDFNMDLPNGKLAVGTEVRLVAQLELVKEE